MRQLIYGAAIAASALAAAAPAAAQWAPQPQPYGNAYGYNNGNYGQTRMLMARVDQIRQQIRQLARRNVLSQREAYRLDLEAQQLRQRLRQLAYGGLNPNERIDIERRIARLEQMVRANATDRNGRYDRGYGYGQQGYGQQGYDNQDGRWQDRDGNWHDRDDRRD